MRPKAPDLVARDEFLVRVNATAGDDTKPVVRTWAGLCKRLQDLASEGVLGTKRVRIVLETRIDSVDVERLGELCPHGYSMEGAGIQPRKPKKRRR